MKFFRHQKGFTLVEMVLYVSLCSIILLALSTFLSFLLGARVRSQAITEVNQQGFQVMYQITQTIRNGRSIQVPSIGSSASTLSVTTGVPLLNPTVFSVSSSTFMIQEGGASAVPLTNARVQISALTFQNISSASSTDKIIRISFTINYINPQGREEYSFTKTFNGSATLRQ
jgi:type II secretory pathway pseudopilin PulG